jgi:hypothetical protein
MANPSIAVISIVDDDSSVGEATGSLLRANGFTVATFLSADLFLASPDATSDSAPDFGCVHAGHGGTELYRLLKLGKAAHPDRVHHRTWHRAGPSGGPGGGSAGVSQQALHRGGAAGCRKESHPLDVPRSSPTVSVHVAPLPLAAGLTIGAFDEMLYRPNAASPERPTKTGAPQFSHENKRNTRPARVHQDHDRGTGDEPFPIIRASPPLIAM